jgi:hypothetical protein
MFIYPTYNHNWRNISTIYTYNKTSIKRNILTIKQNTLGRRSGYGLISTRVINCKQVGGDNICSLTTYGQYESTDLLRILRPCCTKIFSNPLKIYSHFPVLTESRTNTLILQAVPTRPPYDRASIYYNTLLFELYAPFSTYLLITP